MAANGSILTLLFLQAVLLASAVAGEDKKTYCSVIEDGSSKLKIVAGKKVTPNVAWAIFTNSVNSTGWSFLEVHTNESVSDLLQAEAAGLVEGYVTNEFIAMSFKNSYSSYCTKDKEFCDKLKKFLYDNQQWILKQLDNEDEASYWYQVTLINEQMKGLVDGYTQSKNSLVLDAFDFLLMNIFGDLEDLEGALGKKEITKVTGSGSCSALVKVFPKNIDLAISQVTWNNYNSMLRVFKLYDFRFHMSKKGGRKIHGEKQSFSSYPGLIYSGDDFYISSNGLVSQETTIGNSNQDLTKFITSESVLEWMRTIIANRLANSGSQWTSLFARHNSGTYNNQWMILDYKLFTPGSALKPDTFWVLEQIPGAVQMADMTYLLDTQGYWPSFNMPFFKYIYNISGVSASAEKYGGWFRYDTNPRSEIFRRDHVKVTDMQSFFKLMRYNDFQHDPFSKCNCTPPFSAENGISARSDLNPADGKYPFGALSHRMHGGTDCKATNSKLAQSLSCFAVSGPTFDQQPFFQWSKTDQPRPLGHPDVWKFEPMTVEWK